MSSGIAFNEDYFDPLSDFNTMGYTLLAVFDGSDCHSRSCKCVGFHMMTLYKMRSTQLQWQ